MPTYSIPGPDGKTYSIDGPEGASREDIIAKIKERMGSQEPELGFGGTLADVGKSFGRGIAKGAIGLAGLPGNIAHGMGSAIDWGLGALGMEAPEESDILTSDQLTRTVENKFGKFGTPQTEYGKYAQSIGEQVPAMALGPEGMLAKVGSAVGAGVGSEAGSELLEPYGEGAQAVGSIIGGGLGGYASAVPKMVQSGRAANKAADLMADMDATKAASQAGYDWVANNTFGIGHATARNLYNGTENFLNKSFYDKRMAPVTYGLLDDVRKDLFIKGPKGTKVPVDQPLSAMMGLYERLGKIRPGTTIGDEDAAAAGIARSHILNWIDKNAQATGVPAKLKDAMQNWSAYKKMEELTTAEERAAGSTAQSGTAMNFQNYLRHEIERIIDPKFPHRARGYKPEEIEAMKDFVAGSVARNITRIVGKGLSPTSPLGFIRMAVESLYSAPLAIGTAAVGMASHKIGDYLSKQELADIIRMVQERAPVNAVTGPASRAARNAYNASKATGRRFLAKGATVPATIAGDQDEQQQGIPRITVHPRAPADVLANPSGVPDL